MVDFIRKRLQVFVSSTYTDLKQERQAAVEAILTAGHIPAGMELFASGDETQTDVIKQWIDESDIFLLILGGRYGTMARRSEKSYVHVEYEYAIEKGKPFFACVINESAIDIRVKEHGKEVIETDEPQKLKAFRAEVLKKMVKFWDDAKDIKIAIGETLAQFSRREDLVGWVRATEQANMPALADEIARLSKENAVLRNQVATVQAEPSIAGLKFQDMLELLQNKGLLGHLEMLAGQHPEPFWATDPNSHHLIRIGLLSNDRYGKPIFTEAGRVFLNQYELLTDRDNS